MIEGSQTIILGGSVWTQLLTALVVGLLVAFALQVLLTSLGVAIGMSVLAIRAITSRSDADSADLSSTVNDLETAQETDEYSSAHAESQAETAQEISESPNESPAEVGSQIGFWAGFGVLLTVNTVLFAACFLAARFSQAQSPLTGAIEGIVIWSAYLLILIWLSSTAVSSIVGSLLSVATGGFRRMIRPIGSLFSSEESAAMTEAELQTTVRQEIQAAFNPEQLQSLIRAELERFPLENTTKRSATSVMQFEEPTAQERTVQRKTASQPSQPDSTLVDSTLTIVQHQLIQFLQHTDKLTAKRVDRRLRELLEAAQFVLPDTASIPEIDRSKAMRLLMHREDLSEKQRDKILDQIEETWNEFRRSNQKNGENKTENFERNSFVIDSDIASAKSSSAIQQLTDTALKTLADQLPDSLTDNEAVERIRQQLPELLQQAGNQLPAGAGLAVLTMALLRGKDLLPEVLPEFLPETGLDVQQIRQTLDRLLHQSGMADLNQAVVDQVDHLRDRSMQQIEQVQQTVQEKVDTLKTQTSQQLRATQKAAQAAATIAAWWLFLTVSTGAISSALAGAIANRI